MNYKVIYNRNNRFRRDGRAKVHVRITHDREVQYIDTGLIVTPEEFKSLDSNSQFQIKSIELKIVKFLETKRLQGKRFNISQLINFVRSGSSESFIDFCEAHMKTKNITKSTSKKHSDLINKLKDFNHNLDFSKIDNQFVDRFEEYLKSRVKYGGGQMKQNSIAQIMILLRSYINHAFYKGYIFEKPVIRIVKERTKPQVLNMEGLERLESVTNKYIEKVIFMFYTGLRISDTFYDFRELYDGEFVTLKPQKTLKHDLTVNLPVNHLFHGKPLEILKRNDFKFHDCTANTTKHWLIKACKDADIEVITSKCARHSFITNLWELGMPEDYIALLVGHSRSSMTSRYGTRPKSQILNMVKQIFST